MMLSTFVNGRTSACNYILHTQVILSRSNTTQHMYRWAELLLELMDKHGLDAGLVTYAAAELSEQQRMLQSSPDSAMYITSSREIAEAPWPALV